MDTSSAIKKALQRSMPCFLLILMSVIQVKAQNNRIELDQRVFYNTIPLGSDNLVKFDKLDGLLIISFPDNESKYNYSIQFNQAKSKDYFRITFDKSSKPIDSILTITDADLISGKLFLNFQNNALINIGYNTGNPGRSVFKKTVPSKEPVIKILVKKNKDGAVQESIYAALSTEGKPQLKLEVAPDSINPNIFLCSQKADGYCKVGCGIKDNCNPEVMANLFNQVYCKQCVGAKEPNNNKQARLKRLFKKKESDVNAFTASYKIILDQNNMIHLFEARSKDGFEYFNIVKDLTLKPNRWVDIYVQQEKDSTDAVIEAKGYSDFVTPPAILGEGLKIPQIASMPETTPNSSPGNIANGVEGKTADSVRNTIINTDNCQAVKAKLLSLELALEQFNSRYANGVFMDKDYKADLLCMQLNIKRQFQIGLPIGSEGLDELLIQYVIRFCGHKQYYGEFEALIRQIQNHYTVALNNKNGKEYKLVSRSVKVSNADMLTINIKNGRTTFTDTFNIKGGMKIDFSTGFFLNGLGANNFILSNHTYRYKETKDFITANGSDSVVYTGAVRDTSGNLIQQNTTGVSYSIGILVHVYKRTGKSINFGGVLGFSFSNNAPVLMMAGPTMMIKAGSNRISISGGLSAGPQKYLSNEVNSYRLNSKTNPDNKLFNSVYEMPRFYTGSNDIPTYTKWRLSWFVGVSLNLASINL